MIRPGIQAVKRAFVLATVLFLVSACASIPFSTMWKLRSFNGKDLKTLNPADVRVVMKLPEKLQYEPDKTTLDVTLVPKDKQQQVLKEHASLMLVDQGRTVPADVPAAKPGDVWYLMKLNPAGVESFQDFQQRLLPDMKQHYKTLTMSVHFGFGKADMRNLKGLKVSVWLRMKKDEDYFPLLENAVFPSK